MTTRVSVQVGNQHGVEVTITEHSGDDVTERVHQFPADGQDRHFHIHSGHHITVKEKTD